MTSPTSAGREMRLPTGIEWPTRRSGPARISLGLVPATLVLAVVMLSAPLASAGFASPLGLSSPHPRINGSFGDSVAAGGKVFAVGAPSEYYHGIASGRAYLYNLHTGALLHSFHSSHPISGGFFGAPVATDGRILVVGAQGETVGGHAGAGHAYVFDVSTGRLLLTLHSPNPQKSGSFGGGEGFGISAGYVVVAATGEAVGTTTGAGEVYVFNATTGALVVSIPSPHPKQGGAFGFDVGADAPVLVVGAFNEDNGATTSAGNAYLFNLTSGGLLRTLTSPNSQVGGWFGWSVAIRDRLVVVGAIAEDPNGLNDAGEVYFFNASSGAVLASIISPHAVTGGNLGWIVAITAKSVIIGASREVVQGLYYNAGRVYVYDAATASLVHTLVSPNAQTISFLGGFGFAVAGIGTSVVVGAPAEYAYGFSAAGHVYLY